MAYYISLTDSEKKIKIKLDFGSL